MASEVIEGRRTVLPDTGLAGRLSVRGHGRAGGQGDCEHCATRSACVVSALELTELRVLQPLIRQHAFRSGDVLQEEQVSADAVHVIKVGSVFGMRRGLDGPTRPVCLWGRGAAFGISSFYGERTQVGAVAATAGRVCIIRTDVLAAEAARSPALHARVSSMLSGAVGHLAAWSEALRLPGIPRQLAYATLLLSQAQQSSMIELPDQKSLAALLGTSRETIARAMTLLEQEGIVRRHGRRLCEVVRDRVLALLASEPSSRPAALTSGS